MCIVCTKNSRHVYQPPVGPQNLSANSVLRIVTGFMSSLGNNQRSMEPTTYSPKDMLKWLKTKEPIGKLGYPKKARVSSSKRRVQ